ncbi:hypothetical protein A2U01_0052448, partial [Trifolium medium]|nr:hypothetical protein [Trifolium medium]
SSNVFACTAFDRDGKRFPRCVFPHSIGSVPYLTFIARRASRFALDPLIYRIFAPTKSPEQGGLGGGKRMQFRNLNVAPPKPMPSLGLRIRSVF